MNEDSADPSPPSVVPVLSYRGPVIDYRAAPLGSTSGVVTYVRTGDTLVVTIPSPSIVEPLIHRLILLLLTAFMSFAMLTFTISVFRGGFWRDVIPSTIAVLATLFSIWGVFVSVKKIIFTVKSRKMSSSMIVAPDGVTIYSAGRSQPRVFGVLKGTITDLQAIPPASMRASRLTVQIVTRYDIMHMIELPWRDGEPMIELEYNLRDVWGLPPTRER